MSEPDSGTIKKRLRLFAAIFSVLLVLCLVYKTFSVIVYRSEITYSVGRTVGARIIHFTKDEDSATADNYLSFCNEDIKRNLERILPYYTIKYRKNDSAIIVFFERRQMESILKRMNYPECIIVHYEYEYDDREILTGKYYNSSIVSRNASESYSDKKKYFEKMVNDKSAD